MATHLIDLEKQIEDLIHAHLAECRRAAAAAVERAFASQNVRRTSTSRSASAPVAGGRRRTAGELAAMSERLYEAVCANPGAQIVALAAVVGGRPHELHRPMKYLRRAGRVRSVGERHQMRYFPLGARE